MSPIWIAGDCCAPPAALRVSTSGARRPLKSHARVHIQRGPIEMSQEAKGDFFVFAVKKGDLAMVRVLLEDNPDHCLDRYADQARQENTTALNVVARAICASRIMRGLEHEPNLNLDALQLLAARRYDREAIDSFWRAGAGNSIRKTM